MTASYVQTDWYQDPAYYDIIFDEDTELEGTFLEAMLDIFGQSGGKNVLEPACGSGRLVLEMARRGYSVSGFDLSPEMLAYARQRLAQAGETAQLQEADLVEFSFRRRFDLAHCLVSTFKYLMDEDSARSHLECVAQSLRPGGLYVLGLHTTDYDYDRFTRERWVAEREGTHVVCNIQTWPAESRKRREKVRSRLVVREGGETRRLETNWWFRTYDARQLESLIASVPELEHVTTFDFTYDLSAERELDDDQQDCVLILRKR